MLKLKKLSLLGLAVVALLFTACEADFPMGEFDEQLKGPKPWSTIICAPGPDDTAMREACKIVGGNCKKRTSCDKVLNMTDVEYKKYRKENF